MPAEVATIENQQEEERLIRLQKQRQREEESEEARLFTSNIAQKVAAKLNHMIEQGHDTTAFTILFSLAVLKDGVLDWALDFLSIGEIPILGQIPGAFVTAVMIFFMLGKSNFFKRQFRKKLILLIVDLLPFAINNLPLTTIGILWMWHDIRKKADQAKSEMTDLKNKTEEQLKAIDKEEDWELENI